MQDQTRFIFVTGGVVSSLGKGIVAASLGALLKSKGYSVTCQKFDPYLNVDPGTMSPYQHGEVFVTEDGSETDLDLGHYERFTNQNVTKLNNVTSGMVFQEVLNKERNGDYLGATVQIIPHITDEIKRRFSACLKDHKTDILITEIGGTVGDIESLPFLEALRQFTFANPKSCCHIHVTLVPFLEKAGEFKTKPTQHSIKELRGIGIHPNIIVCRAPEPITPEQKQKISMFCDVDTQAVISCSDANSIYDVPLMLENEGLENLVCDTLDLKKEATDMSHWKDYIQTMHNPTLKTITIGIVGKYTELSDSYISVVEALKHAAVANHCKLDIKWIRADDIEAYATKPFMNVSALLIPGGFGKRGLTGKIAAAKFAREKNMPMLGLCLGMHVLAIEFARHVLHINDADSSEFDEKTTAPIIHLLEEQEQVTQKGGSMRLGAYPCKIMPKTKLSKLYKRKTVQERHRHRYEFNNAYKEAFEDSGIVFSGLSPDEALVEVMELRDHPFYIACQFHPEFKSRPTKPHPLFEGFIAAARTFSGIQQELF